MSTPPTSMPPLPAGAPSLAEILIHTGQVDWRPKSLPGLFEKMLWRDEATGAKIVATALEAPLRHIAANAGFEGAVKVREVADASGAFGLNASTGELVDLVKAGVIDPAKVTRSALMNAASIAALFLTTEAVIVDKPEPAAPAMPGGGMDDF